MVGSWRNERLRLSRDAGAYQGFLDRLAAGVEEHYVRLYLFCLRVNRKCREDISFRGTVEALEPELIPKVVSRELGVEVESFRERRRSSPLPALAAKFLLRYGGQAQREVAHFLGMSTGSAVCVQARKFESWIAEDRRLARVVRKIERRLDKEKEGAPNR